MHILDILEDPRDPRVRKSCEIFVSNAVELLKCYLMRCRIEKDLTVELQIYGIHVNLLCYDNLLLPMFMKKHVLLFPTGLYVARKCVT